jgi:hypothetical protein
MLQLLTLTAVTRSTLSHDFYQVMVGSKGMSLHGWRQLIEWSIEHSSLDKDELERFKVMWEPLWHSFIYWVNMEFEHVQRIIPVESPKTIKQGEGESVEAWEVRKQEEDSRVELERLRFEDAKAQWRERIGGLQHAP